MAPSMHISLQPCAAEVESEVPPAWDPKDFQDDQDVPEPEGQPLSAGFVHDVKSETGLCGISSWDSTDSEISVQTFAKQRLRKQRNKERLELFLKEHNFSEDVGEPRLPRMSCTGFGKEALYPIHVAASLGDAQMLRLLVKAGADLQQRTSKGRTATEFALEHDDFGSHRDVLDLLRGKIQTMALREFMSLMNH